MSNEEKPKGYPRIGVQITDHATLEEAADFAFENILQCTDESVRGVYKHGYGDGYRRGRAAPNEPEVKAQGFEEWWETVESNYDSWWVREAMEECWQAAKATQVRLPEKKQLPEAHQSPDEFAEGYNAAINDMRKLNGLENV